MRPSRGLVGLLAVIVVLLGFTTAAGAGEEDGGSNTGTTLIRPSVNNGTIGIGLEGTAPGSSTGLGLPAWLLECRWEETTRFEIDDYFGQITSERPVLENYAPGEAEVPYYIVFCSPDAEARAQNPGIVVSGVLEFWEVGEPFPAIINDWLIARAVASAEIPVQVGQSAPFGDVDVPMITQLETFLWVDEAIWQPVSATPAPVFGVTVTATATPIAVEFEGDDEYVNCGANEGPPYDPNLHSDLQSSDCVVTYRHSSSVGDFTLTSRVMWEISWVCSFSCGAGTLPEPFVAERIRDVRVAELIGVGTSIGSD